MRTGDQASPSKKRVEADKAYLVQLKDALSKADLSESEVARAMQPASTFHAQIVEEVDTYKRMRCVQSNS